MMIKRLQLELGGFWMAADTVLYEAWKNTFIDYYTNNLLKKTRPKNSTIKPPSTLLIPCMKIQKEGAPPPPPSYAHASRCIRTIFEVAAFSKIVYSAYCQFCFFKYCMGVIQPSEQAQASISIRSFVVYF